MNQTSWEKVSGAGMSCVETTEPLLVPSKVEAVSEELVSAPAVPRVTPVPAVVSSVPAQSETVESPVASSRRQNFAGAVVEHCVAVGAERVAARRP